MKVRLSVLALGLLTGCGGAEITYPGTDMGPYFPFDGTRSWEFVSTDETLAYKIIATMRSDEPEVVDGINTYPVDYTYECVRDDEGCVDGNLLRTIVWANDLIQGAFIYSWTEGDGAELVFDPPLRVSQSEMRVGDFSDTTTGGATWTSTLEAMDECPVLLNADWSDCAKFVITDGDDSDETGFGLVGSYWAIPNYNVVGIELVGDTGIWQLLETDCTPEEACDGSW